MEKINFNSGGQEIRGTLLKPELLRDKNPGVILFHGMTSSEKNYIPLAERLATQGIVAMTLSIRGHGSSEGDFNSLTISDAILDGFNAYDFFTKYDFVDPVRIGICGASLGATIASYISSERTVSSLVLRAPATYTDEMMSMTYKKIMDTEKDVFQKMTAITETPPILAIAKFKGSLLVIISENDQVIPDFMPEEYLQNAKQAARKEKVMIKDATHNLTEERWRQEFIDDAIGWFVDTL